MYRYIKKVRLMKLKHGRNVSLSKFFEYYIIKMLYKYMKIWVLKT